MVQRCCSCETGAKVVRQERRPYGLLWRLGEGRHGEGYFQRWLQLGARVDSVAAVTAMVVNGSTHFFGRGVARSCRSSCSVDPSDALEPLTFDFSSGSRLYNNDGNDFASAPVMPALESALFNWLHCWI